MSFEVVSRSLHIWRHQRFLLFIDFIDENLTLFILFHRFPLDSQIFSIATEDMPWLQKTTDYTPYAYIHSILYPKTVNLREGK